MGKDSCFWGKDMEEEMKRGPFRDRVRGGIARQIGLTFNSREEDGYCIEMLKGMSNEDLPTIK